MPGNGPNGDNPKKDALNLMKQGKYQKALSKLDQVQDEKNRNWVNLNKGICLHYLQKDTEAKKRFDYVITKSTEKYHIGLAHFYLEEYLLSLYFFMKNITKTQIDNLYLLESVQHISNFLSNFENIKTKPFRVKMENICING